MRLLHCTDFHANFDWYRWLAQTAPAFDLVCLSGDLLHLSSPHPIPCQIAEIKTILGSIRTPLAVCSGNHDTIHAEGDGEGKFWINDLRRKNVWVDGDRFNLGGYAFCCHPWNEPIRPAMPSEIWIIHSPPEGCPAARGESSLASFGDEEFASICRKGHGPRLALCGHVHAPFSWHAEMGVTRVFNPGCATKAPWPSHVIFDLEIGTATRRCHSQQNEIISFLQKTPHELLRNISDERLEEILRVSVLNLRIEGCALTSSEIEECCRQLRKIARGES